MVRLEKTICIDCELNRLFDFHLDANNIKKITPLNITVNLLNDDTRTYEGKIIKLKTTRFFIPIFWEVLIKRVDKPSLLHDIAVKSPFKFWSHKHIFYNDGDMSILKDVIEFELPFGFIGKVFELFIKKDVSNMFNYRHQKTKELLEK